MMFRQSMILLLLALFHADITVAQEDKPKPSNWERCLNKMAAAVQQDNNELLATILKDDTEKPSCVESINLPLPDGNKGTLLMDATLAGKSREVVTTLLDYGADDSISNKRGFKPLHGAAMMGNVELTKLLLEHSKTTVDINDTRDGETPLLLAAWGNQPEHVETVQVLIDAGADVDFLICNDPDQPCKHVVDLAHTNSRKILHLASKNPRYQHEYPKVENA